jgi:NTE family protein
MRGLVLEGGGAKGSYHVGALKALYDNGYTFDGVAGTSIGAINGAMVVQEDYYETCLSMWTTIQPSDILDLDNVEVAKLIDKEYNKDNIKYWLGKARSTIKNLGVPTDKVIPYLKNYIDEDKVRNSGRDFALVTVSLSDRKALELHLDDIPYGQLHELILASAYYPLFKLEKIQGKYYIDGGIYDNLPINALLSKNKYDEIIAIRTNIKALQRPIKDKSVNIKIIQPAEDLGHAAEFNTKKMAYNMKLGYYDGLRLVKGYSGRLYYIDKFQDIQISNYFHSLSQDAFEKIKILLNFKKELTNDEVIAGVYNFLKKDNIISNEDNFIAFLEKYAMIYGVERFKIYNFEDFAKQLEDLYKSHKKNKEKKLKPIIYALKANNLFEIILSDKIKGDL